MISAKWTAIFPLRVANAIALANRNPAMLANRLPRPRVGLLKPRDDERRLWLELAVRDVVVRQRAVEWILMGNESDRDIIAPGRRIGVIESTVCSGPIRVPRALIVGHRVIASRLFSNPKHRGHDVAFPREASRRRARGRWHEHLRLHL